MPTPQAQDPRLAAALAAVAKAGVNMDSRAIPPESFTRAADALEAQIAKREAWYDDLIARDPKAANFYDRELPGARAQVARYRKLAVEASAKARAA